jgi:hypothetical protein
MATITKARTRRVPSESEKIFECPFKDCEKAYISKTSLSLHVRRIHRQDQPLKDNSKSQVPELTISKKFKRGVNLNKVFKEKDLKRLNYTGSQAELSVGGTNKSSLNFNTNKKMKTGFTYDAELDPNFTQKLSEPVQETVAKQAKSEVLSLSLKSHDNESCKSDTKKFNRFDSMKTNADTVETCYTYDHKEVNIDIFALESAFQAQCDSKQHDIFTEIFGNPKQIASPLPKSMNNDILDYSDLDDTGSVSFDMVIEDYSKAKYQEVPDQWLVNRTCDNYNRDLDLLSDFAGCQEIYKITDNTDHRFNYFN